MIAGRQGMELGKPEVGKIYCVLSVFLFFGISEWFLKKLFKNHLIFQSIWSIISVKHRVEYPKRRVSET